MALVGQPEHWLAAQAASSSTLSLPVRADSESESEAGSGPGRGRGGNRRCPGPSRMLGAPPGPAGPGRGRFTNSDIMAAGERIFRSETPEVSHFCFLKLLQIQVRGVRFVAILISVPEQNIDTNFSANSTNITPWPKRKLLWQSLYSHVQALCRYKISC